MKEDYMKRLSLVWLVFCLLFVDMACDFQGQQGTQGVPKTVKELAMTKVDNSNHTETSLTKWVYDHSNKISMKTATYIVKEALKTNKPLLLLALPHVESEFTPTAVSNVGAKGLTQVMWRTWGPDLIKMGIAKEERDLFDIDVSIQAGNYVLDQCLKQSGGDVAKTLERYLGGRDGYYKNRITENLANLYILVSVNMKFEPEKVVEKKEVKKDVKDQEVKKP
jgi:hypothetical protein